MGKAGKRGLKDIVVLKVPSLVAALFLELVFTFVIPATTTPYNYFEIIANAGCHRHHEA